MSGFSGLIFNYSGPWEQLGIMGWDTAFIQQLLHNIVTHVNHCLLDAGECEASRSD